MSNKYLSAVVVDLKDTGHGGWTAVASTPQVDHEGESLAEGCFLPLPASVPVHVDHSLKIEDCVGRARPYYDGPLLMLDGVFASSEKAQHVRQLCSEGVVDAMSVVFVEAIRKSIDGVQTVVKGKLKAVDFVTIGCNSDARLVSVRGYQEAHPGITDADLVLLAKARLAVGENMLALNYGSRRAPAPPSTKSILADLAGLQEFLTDLSRKDR